MHERSIDIDALQTQANILATRLKEAAVKHERSFPSRIQAVFVFSGPGTYDSPLKPGETEWLRWMDRDRIRAGIAVVRETTATRKSEQEGHRIKSPAIGNEEVANSGPFFVYAGIPVENKAFRHALESKWSKLPKEKVVIIDGVQEQNGSVTPIRHTGDQVQALFQQITNPVSPLYGISDIALVSHLAHFIRIPFYLNKYQVALGYYMRYLAYPLRGRPNVLEKDIAEEMSRLIQYGAQGELAPTPAVISF